MESIKIFLDHFYFSLVAVVVGLAVLYLILSSVADFSVGNHWLAAVCVWLGASAALAALLSYRTVRNRRQPPIPYTRREP